MGSMTEAVTSRVRRKSGDAVKRDEPLKSAFPRQATVARWLGLPDSTLSRRSDIKTVKIGRSGVVIPPAEVLRLADEYGKPSVNEIAAELLDHAAEADPGSVEKVEKAINDFFARREDPPPPDPNRFLEIARRSLPKDLYVQVEVAYQHGLNNPVGDLVSPHAED